MGETFLVSEPKSTALRALNYSPATEAFKRKGKLKKCEQLGDLLSVMGPSYRVIFTRLDCDRAHGVELLSQSDMFATEPHGRVIREDSMSVPDDNRIRKWQVLIAGAGTLGETELFGRAIIADNRLENKFVGPDALVLTLKEPESAQSLYTYAFLCSKAGTSCIRSTCYGTKILGLRSDLLADMPIPFGSEQVVEKVASLIRTAVNEREVYAREFSLARAPIQELKMVREAWNLCREERARCLLWKGDLPTLGAWNYASAGNALRLLQEKWPGRLSDLLEEEGVFLGPRFGRIPCAPPYGVEFITQRDVFLIRPVPRRIVKPNLADGDLFVHKHAILLGARGQLTQGTLFGRAELAAFGAHEYAITGDIMRVLPEADQAECLFVFLSTELGMKLLRTTAIGTSIPAMHVGLVRSLPVPDLTPQQTQTVKKHLAKAVAARVAATKGETEAIRIIEEEVLPEWLS